MRKKKITYGINGLMTYQAVFKTGNVKVVVMFSDGSMTATGKRPATFTTDSLMMQHIIENSAEFKKGFIFRYRNLVLNEEVELEKNPSRCECQEPEDGCKRPHHNHHHHHEGKDEIEVEECIGDDIAGEDLIEDCPAESEEEELEATPEEELEATPEEESSEAGEAEGVVKVFSFNDEAKDYLEETFGIDRNQIKTRPEIIKAGAENGVTIEFRK